MDAVLERGDRRTMFTWFPAKGKAAFVLLRTYEAGEDMPRTRVVPVEAARATWDILVSAGYKRRKKVAEPPVCQECGQVDEHAATWRHLEVVLCSECLEKALQS